MATEKTWSGPDLVGDRPLLSGAVCATGLLMISAPTVLQIMWLVVVAAAAMAGPQFVRRSTGPRRATH